jgi:hypothetical protein
LTAVAGAEPRLGTGTARWLLLFHQIPPTPSYLRAKVGRRLARIGALTLKNTVYVLPATESTFEDLQWVRREVTAGGGDATLVEARFVDGLSDADVERRFQDARDEDYALLTQEVRAVAGATPRRVLPEDDRRTKLEGDVARFEARLEQITALDFFHAPGREAAAAVVKELRSRLANAKPKTEPRAPGDLLASCRGKVWVTRVGIHVDRIASAWLVRRFVDSAAEFKFVAPRGYRPEPDELRFDMFEAEFTHEGDLCTFEVLLGRLRIDEPGLPEIAEIIHDIDVKDDKFARQETAGVAAMIGGLCIAHHSDDERLERGFALFDELRAFFARKRKAS